MGQGIPTADELFAGLKCQAGFKCNRAELSEDLRTLLQCALPASLCVLLLILSAAIRRVVL
jgi:hypothetical protein